ncbi:MAG TPA: hypothetical protein VGB89_06595 [Bacteroidota bacterium]|jgi:response regulator RpfG family c-di-GMP phosphodiesterase
MVPSTKSNERQAQPSTTEEKKRIFIYSPDLNFCFSLSMLFQDRYSVVTTTNPGMIESCDGTHAPHLVIVDAVPSESLLEKIAGLKKRQPNIPIISLYVYSERAKELEERLRSHVDALYYKPIDVNDLSSRIAELLPA